jgi:hypothetical protein
MALASYPFLLPHKLRNKLNRPRIGQYGPSLIAAASLGFCETVPEPFIIIQSHIRHRSSPA